MRALFLTTPELSQGSPHNDNHVRLPAAFAAADWQVDVAHHDSLALHDGTLRADAYVLCDYDLIWPVGFGPNRGFLDRQQLLSLCPTTALISDPLQLTTLHSKTSWLRHAPLSMVARETAVLARFMSEHGGDWVLKPTAASFGAQVYKLSTPAELEPLVTGDRYWLLQRYLPQITQGETRTLIVRGCIIGSYLRRPAEDSFVANMARGAMAEAVQLEPAAQVSVRAVMAELNRANIGFAAIDTCAAYVLEVNVANPGGLATLAQVYGRAFDADVVTAVSQQRSTDNR